MHPERKKRLEELKKQFNLIEIGDGRPPNELINRTIARYLNQLYGRTVVVSRESPKRHQE